MVAASQFYGLLVKFIPDIPSEGAFYVFDFASDGTSEKVGDVLGDGVAGGLGGLWYGFVEGVANDVESDDLPSSEKE